MRLLKKDRQQLVDFLMKASSLDDLLGILASICENLDMETLNPRLRQFRHFRFMFFGLLVKARGILDNMLFRAESMNLPGFAGINPELLGLKKVMDLAYRDVNNDRMLQAKERIISAREGYSGTYEGMRKLSGRLL